MKVRGSFCLCLTIVAMQVEVQYLEILIKERPSIPISERA